MIIENNMPRKGVGTKAEEVKKENFLIDVLSLWS
jgi:hypothetical protein